MSPRYYSSWEGARLAYDNIPVLSQENFSNDINDTNDMSGESNVVNVDVIVHCLRATNLKAGQGMFGKADPYAQLQVGDVQSFKTTVNNAGGKNPVWNQEFEFKFSSADENLKITIYDYEKVGNDKFMGGCTISLSYLSAQQNDHEFTYSVLDRGGKDVGQILLKVECENWSERIRSKKHCPICKK